MRKLLVLLVGVCFASTIACGFWVTSVRDRKWADLEARVESLRRDLDSLPLARLPLGRTLVPGNAWDDYMAADPHLPGTPYLTIGGKIQPWLRGDAGASRPEVEALLTQFAAPIDRVRSGARRDFAKAPTAIILRKGLAVQDAIDLCIAKARLLAEAGESAAALDLLVDVALCGRDVAAARCSGAATTGIHILGWAFRELMFLMRTLEIPRSELQRLELVLQVLDDHFLDTSDDLRADLLEFGELLQREDREVLYFENGRRSRRSWRYCFSTRLQATSQFAAAEDIVRRGLGLNGKPWSEEGPGNQALYLEIQQFKDPILATSLNHLVAAQWATMTRGQLRLVRVGLHYQASAEILDLDDPAGGRIRSRLTERSARFWRAGLYGSADWEPKPGPRSYDDIMTLELPR